MSPDSQNAIEFRIGPVEIRCTGEAEWVSRQARQIIDSMNVLGVDGLASKEQRKETLSDLLSRSQASTFGEKAAVVAYWLQEHGGRLKWQSGEIVKELRRLGEKVPTNITDALNHKVRRGYFVTTDRMWELTPAGRSWVLYDLLGEREEEEINTYVPDLTEPVAIS